MDIRDVVVIIDNMRFSKDDIVRDIQEEGYKHNFFFANFNEIEVTQEHLEQSDEVWVWGDCKDNVYYKIAKELGCDIWQMRA